MSEGEVSASAPPQKQVEDEAVHMKLAKIGAKIFLGLVVIGLILVVVSMLLGGSEKLACKCDSVGCNCSEKLSMPNIPVVTPVLKVVGDLVMGKKAESMKLQKKKKVVKQENMNIPLVTPAIDALKKAVMPKKAGQEYLVDPDSAADEDAQVLGELGYDEGAGWSDILASTELDASVIDNQAAFVADVRRFSSGANFTSVNDDNTNAAFTNFVGLRRPQSVHIGADARQQPDVDENVLMRNKDLRW